MGKVIRTKTELSAILAENCLESSFYDKLEYVDENGVVQTGIPETTHFFDLTPPQIAKLSEVYQEMGNRYFVELNGETVQTLYGLREAREDEAPRYKFGKPPKAFIADNDNVNRMFSEARGSELADIMEQKRFATSTPFMVMTNRKIGNGGTRGGAVVKILQSDPTFKIVVPVEFGVPPQFRDLWDYKNREKKLKDLMFQNPNFIPDSVLDTGYNPETGSVEELAEIPTAVQKQKYRDKLSSEYVAFVNFTLLRLKGSHIHASSDDESILRFVETKCPEAYNLAWEVYRHAIAQNGKTQPQFALVAPSQFMTVLALASMKDTNPDEWDGVLVVDWDIVHRALQDMLASTTTAGPFGKMLAQFEEYTGKAKKKLSRKAKFDTLINGMRQWLENGVVESNCLPKEVKAGSKASKEFPTLGGLDIGHITESE